MLVIIPSVDIPVTYKSDHLYSLGVFVSDYFSYIGLVPDPDENLVSVSTIILLM